MTDTEDDLENYAYLDILGRKLDDRQRAVCCRTENTVVAAGAGSGKTQVLATRFAWLVMSCGIPAGEILTLTFTNKAACEMYARIYGILSGFASDARTPEPERSRAAAAVAGFSGVHIQTLDSYCGGILRRAAPRYGIRPDFVSGGTGADIGELALGFAMSHRNSPAVHAFAEPGKIQDFAENYLAAPVLRYSTLADPPGHFVSRLAVQRKLAAERWNMMFCPETAESGRCVPAGLVGEICGKVSSCAPAESGDPAYFMAVEDAAGSFPEFRPISPEGIADGSDASYVRAVMAAVNSVTSARTSKRSGPAAGLKACVSALDEFSDEISSIGDYVLRYKAMENLFMLMDEFREAVNSRRRSAGTLSFSDVTDMALLVLKEQKDIRRQEKHAFSKIMIDEFQDNNGKNRDLLFLLSEADTDGEYGCSDGIPDASMIRKDKLFFVGDEKQSIYKFRGADVSVFNRLRDDLGRGNFFSMEYNYRSSAELLSSFNMMFGGQAAVFDPSPDRPEFEAGYEIPAARFNAAEGRPEQLPEITAGNTGIHVCLMDRSGDDKDAFLDCKEQAAFFMAEKIRGMCAEKGIPFGSAAVLTKSRADYRIIIKWLERLGVPVETDMNAGIFADSVVNDVYSFLRLCVYPSDSGALASFLCSPLAGMEPREVAAFLAVAGSTGGADGKSAPDTDSFIESGDRIRALEDDIGAERAGRLVSALRFLRDRRDSVNGSPLASTISFIWNDCGYRYEAAAAGGICAAAERQFDLMFELARKADADGRSTSWFVDQLEAVREGEGKFFRQDTDDGLDSSNTVFPSEREDAVRLMTIHKSKGLQFSHVFIWGCFGAGFSASRENFFCDEETGVSVRPSSGSKDFFALRRQEGERMRSLAEFRRLLYVAVTRAEDSVWLVGGDGAFLEKEPSPGSSCYGVLESNIRKFYGGKIPGPGERVFSPGAPYDLMMVPPVERSVLGGFGGRDVSRDEVRRRFGRALDSRGPDGYIKTPPAVDMRISPSGLEREISAGEGTRRTGCPELDAVISRCAGYAGFGHAEFGTLVHDFLRIYTAGSDPMSYTPPDDMYRSLRQDDVRAVTEICRSMAEAFSRSSYGREAMDARRNGNFLRAEWPFRYSDGGTVVSGAMDLIYRRRDGSYVIVDYKTDSAAVPERYAEQLRCYRTAAAEILGAAPDRISCVLFFLRDGSAVEM